MDFIGVEFVRGPSPKPFMLTVTTRLMAEKWWSARQLRWDHISFPALDRLSLVTISTQCESRFAVRG